MEPEEIKIIRKNFGLNQTEFGEMLGVGIRSVQNWESGKRNMSESVKILLEKKIKEKELLTGIGEKLNDETAPAMEVKKIHNPPYREAISDDEVALYDIDASANLKTLFDSKQPNILDTLKIPNLPKCDGAVYVRGDSMYPLLKSGDIVAYKQISNLEYLVFGEMYLVDFAIDGDYFLAVKFINKSEKEGHIKLVSHNTHHEPMDVPISNINALALVKASVRINTMM